MKIEISNLNKDIIKTSDVFHQNNETPRPFHKVTNTVVEKHWTSKSKEIWAGGTHLIIHDIHVHEEIGLKTIEAPKIVSLLFLENGTIHIGQSGKITREITSLQHNLIYNSMQTEETVFNKQQKLRITSINFQPNYF